jgi:hypothetical protein
MHRGKPPNRLATWRIPTASDLLKRRPIETIGQETHDQAQTYTNRTSGQVECEDSDNGAYPRQHQALVGLLDRVAEIASITRGDQ